MSTLSSCVPRRLVHGTLLWVMVVLGLLLVVPAPPALGAPGEITARNHRFAGRPLAEALRILEDEGLPIFFSSIVVRPAMKVEVEPRGGTLRELLDDLLRAHGLRVEDGPRNRLIVVAAEEESPAADSRDSGALPVTAEEIVVTTSGEESRHGEPVGASQLELVAGERDLPHMGSDVFRGAGLLPGAATPESSSRLSVRGGRWQDVTVVLDGLELVTPYHLQEFDAALGIVPTDPLARVELISDPAPVEYGDRMGGILDMTSRTPQEPLAVNLGLGSLFAEASASGTFAGEQGRWLSSARSGNYRLALAANGRQENPRYWDLFSKLEYHPLPSHTLQLRLLLAEDEFSASSDTVGDGSYRSRWASSYLWLTHVASLGRDAVIESSLWKGQLERLRTGREAEPGALRLALTDSRELELTGGRTFWHLAPSGKRWQLDAGVELREFRSILDYAVDRQGGAEDLISTMSDATASRFAGQFTFDQAAAFASARLNAAPGLTLEGGLRYDRIGLTDEEHLSPRLHLAWSPRPADVVRLAWGRYFQSQRPYDLQVEDGETEISPAEEAEQRLLSFERRLAGGSSWRVAGYEHLTRNPRPRYEALFDTTVLYPELALGRVPLAPDASRAIGIELSFHGSPLGRFRWSAAYSLSSATDRIDERWVPRANDETHSLRLDGHYRLRHRWSLSGVWHYHTGWPTTAIGVEPVAGGDGSTRFESVLGPIRGERLPSYHRLDLRVGRSWQLHRGRLGAWIDLQNVYDHHNVRGFQSFRLGFDPEGDPIVDADDVSWGGFLPSFSVHWSF